MVESERVNEAQELKDTKEVSVSIQPNLAQEDLSQALEVVAFRVLCKLFPHFKIYKDFIWNYIVR